MMRVIQDGWQEPSEDAMPKWLTRLNEHVPIRYAPLAMCALLSVLGAEAFVWRGQLWGLWLALLGLALVVLGIRDIRQPARAGVRNYAVSGHLRYFVVFI